MKHLLSNFSDDSAHVVYQCIIGEMCALELNVIIVKSVLCHCKAVG